MWILDPRVNFASRSPSSKATPWRGQAAYGLGVTSQLTTHGERGPRWETRLIHLCVPVVPLRDRPRFRTLRTMTPVATQKWILLQKWLRPMKWVLETYPTPCCELSCLEQADWEAGLPLWGKVEDLLEGIHLWRPIVGKRWACCLQLSPREPQDQATSDWDLKTALPPGKLGWAGNQASCSETHWKQATGVLLWSASWCRLPHKNTMLFTALDKALNVLSLSELQLLPPGQWNWTECSVSSRLRRKDLMFWEDSGGCVLESGRQA